MRASRHNGRAGKNGVYSASHNGRRFDVENADHIDAERSEKNIYWDVINGIYLLPPGEELPEDRKSFEDVEQFYYSAAYRDFVEGQNARNEKNRHPERNRTTEDVRLNKKTCPEETIYQIGNMEDHVSFDVLALIVNEFMSEISERFGEHVRILDWALHVDEGTPHIHERHVFECENRYGELCPQQEKALEALGFDLPDPDKKPGRYNNRKMVFDSACRVLLLEIAKKHGLHLEEEPETGGRKYLEKQEFILQKQREKIAAGEQVLAEQSEQITRGEQALADQGERIAVGEQSLARQGTQIRAQENMLVLQDTQISKNAEEISEQEEKLDDLTMKVDDLETLITDVSVAAYDKAVAVVTEQVSEQTRQEDLNQISAYKNWLLKPDQKTSRELRTFAARHFDGLAANIRKLAAVVVSKVKDTLMRPEVRNANVEAVKETARESVIGKLKKNQDEIRRRDQNRDDQRKPKSRKQNMNI